MNYIAIIFLIVSCATQSTYQFKINPRGKGVTRLGQISNSKYYLENSCNAQDKGFKLISKVDDPLIDKSEFFKKYDLEVIELLYIKSKEQKFEVQFTQSGCSDPVLVMDFNFNRKIGKYSELVESLRVAIKEIPFASYSMETQEKSLKVLNKFLTNRKQACKFDKNFVAFKTRTLCQVKVDDLNYQLLWGELKQGKTVISLTSSAIQI